MSIFLMLDFEHSVLQKSFHKIFFVHVFFVIGFFFMYGFDAEKRDFSIDNSFRAIPAPLPDFPDLFMLSSLSENGGWNLELTTAVGII